MLECFEKEGENKVALGYGLFYNDGVVICDRTGD
jgi:hypothetical protein